MSEIRALFAGSHTRGWVAPLVFLLLVSATACGSDEAGPEPIVLRLVDEAGEPVSTAEVFVFMPPDSTSEAAGSFAQATGVLTRSGGPEGHKVIVQAPGFRTEEVEDWKEDRTLVLRPGFLVQIRVAGGLPSVEPPLRLVFGLEPAPPGDAVLPEPERMKILELMTLAAPLEEGELDLPRGSAGLVVTDSAAAHGIRVPMDGRFVVRWGIYDPEKTVWFTLEEGSMRPIGVEDDDRPQVFEIPITQEAVDRAKAELGRRAEELDAR